MNILADTYRGLRNIDDYLRQSILLVTKYETFRLQYRRIFSVLQQSQIDVSKHRPTPALIGILVIISRSLTIESSFEYVHRWNFPSLSATDHHIRSRRIFSMVETFLINGWGREFDISIFRGVQHYFECLQHLQTLYKRTGDLHLVVLIYPWLL